MAAMKTAVGRLYMLFNACLPENEKIKKRLSLSKITESTEYNELKNYEPFKDEFNKNFSKDKLDNYDIAKLEEIIEVIPKIIPLIENINNAIIYGNAAELSEKDIPDYCSVKSVNALSKKINIEQSEPNITNIDKNNFMRIFSSDTIKDPAEALKSISADDINNPSEAVKRILNQSFYCIKEKDVNDIKEKYAEQISSIKDKLNTIKQEKWKLRYKKWLFIGVAIILLTLINTFELLSPDWSAMLTLLSTILMILYFFIG